MLYEYLKKKKYKELMPIFASDLTDVGVNKGKVRKELMNLANEGKLVRFDTGIYYLPSSDGAEFDERQFIVRVIERRYLQNGDDVFGYLSCGTLATSLNFTSMNNECYDYDIVSNAATREHRILNVYGFTLVVREPKVPVTKENYKILQLLDLIKDMSNYRFEDFPKIYGSRIALYMKENNISVKGFRHYLKFYPERTFKNLYLMELLDLNRSRFNVKRIFKKLPEEVKGVADK